KGLSDLIREEFGVRTTALAMGALLIANAAVTISEFVGIAAAGEIFGISRYLTVPAAALLIWFIATRGNYASAERIFLVLTLVFATYVISAIAVRPDWLAVTQGTFIPSFQLNSGYLLTIIALIGTTISPYMQFSLQAIIADKGVKLEEYRLER